jgi:hypothetical protein
MSSTNPPHSIQSKITQEVSVQTLMRGISGQTFASLASLTLTLPPGKPCAPSGASAKALELVNFLPDSIHLVVLSELGRHFSPQVSARFVPGAASAEPPFKVQSSFGSAFDSATLPPLHPAQLDAQVTQLGSRLDSTWLDISRQQIEWPSLWLASALGLHQSVPDRRGLATCGLMDTAVLLATGLNMHLKQLLGVPRPNDPRWSAPVHQPLLPPMPLNQSYPGGHAMILTTIWAVLNRVIGAKVGPTAMQGLRKVADFLIDNRMRAGLHTARDNEVGRAVGEWLGEQMVMAAAPATAATNGVEYWAALVELAESEW